MSSQLSDILAKQVPKDEPLNIVCPISLDIPDGPKIKIVKTYKSFYEYNGKIQTRSRYDAEISLGDKVKVVKFSHMKGDNELEVILQMLLPQPFEFIIRYDCLEKRFDFAEWQELNEDENFYIKDYISEMLSSFRQIVNKWAENASVF